MKHSYLVEVETDGRYNTVSKENDLMETIAGRIWNLQGVVPHGASAKLVGGDVVVISRAEYDELRAHKRHLQGMMGQDVKVTIQRTDHVDDVIKNWGDRVDRSTDRININLDADYVARLAATKGSNG